MSHSFKLTLIVVSVLVGLSFLPRAGVGKKPLKKVNILSELFSNDYLYDGDADAYFDTAFLARLLDAVPVDTVDVAEAAPLDQTWALGSSKPVESAVTDISQIDTSKVISIEDFGNDGRAMAAFYRALDERGRNGLVRIAVLGDSFIEGDIITADLREQLQDLYGGGGAGFVPFGSAVAKYRPTVTQTFDKWKIYDITNKKNNPEELSGKFFISGTLAIPQEGAVTKITGSTYRKHIKSVSTARLLFINEKNAVIDVTVNDTLKQQFRPSPRSSVQQIALNGDIASLEIKITDPDGFIGYGVMLEDNTGLQVDNYSVRGNSGLSLFDADASIIRQINAITGYDLIILEYGLNVLSADVLEYGSFGAGLTGVIRYIQRCFPNASILVMGVGDRSTMRDGEPVTMPSVSGMIRAQRKAAEDTGVAFWDTFRGMGGENSMVQFVEWNWAAKDYTHIGFPGGRYIARELVKAIMKDKLQSGPSVRSLEPVADSIVVETVPAAVADTVAVQAPDSLTLDAAPQAPPDSAATSAPAQAVSGATVFSPVPNNQNDAER